MLVCFDPGRNLGVLKAPAQDRKAIVHGVNWTTLKLKDTTDPGAYLRSADELIREWLRGATRVAVERPNTERQHYAAIRKNMMLLGHIAYWAHCELGIVAEEINVSHVKSALTDNGNAKKELVIDRAEYLMGMPAGSLTEHEADALGVWMVASFGPPMKAAERARAFTARKRAAKEAAKAAARGALPL
jgi:Holliday junction resolvasome RuvABC endonuclease subunit